MINQEAHNYLLTPTPDEREWLLTDSINRERWLSASFYAQSKDKEMFAARFWAELGYKPKLKVEKVEVAAVSEEFSLR